MRPHHLLVTFLLISILISHAQGIRLNKGFQTHEDQKIQKEIETKKLRGSGADVEVVNLKDDHISGDSSKFMAKATSISHSTTSTTSKNDGSNRKIVFSSDKDESLSVHSTLGSEHQGTTSEQYSDTIDLAEMDYTPAKRKPPIHN